VAFAPSEVDARESLKNIAIMGWMRYQRFSRLTSTASDLPIDYNAIA